ncbi:MAG TPA: SMC-Scp complex subunit ScpB [Mariprofundaceae bacterium]|nr:SMC-Scp complex subunit ScpB [Mariprofundaceae bacterium]
MSLALPLLHQIEALILASDEPLSLQRLRDLTGAETTDIRTAAAEIESFYADRGIRLVQVGGGWQFRTAPEFAEVVQGLWQTRAPKLSRSTLETLAIIAYRQPTTRAEIEALRGVKTSSNIVAGLQERGWIKVVGRKEVPGRPHLFGTTKQFLTDFGLNSLRDLPDSSQLLDEDEIQQIITDNQTEESELKDAEAQTTESSNEVYDDEAEA